MDIKIHPRALFTDIGFCHRWDSEVTRDRRRPAVGVRVAFDNDEGLPLTGPEDIVSAKLPPTCAHLPDNELLAVVALMQYVHELGEHVQIEGVQLNHHEPGGLRTAARLIKHVSAWLDDLAADPRAP